MVTEDEVQRVVLAHGDSLSPCIVILRDNPIGHFVVIAHEVCGHAVDGLEELILETIFTDINITDGF